MAEKLESCFCLRKNGQFDIRKGGKDKMRKRGKRLAKIFVALTCAGTLWLAGADFSPVPNASGQSVVQSYTKPQAVPDFSIPNLQGKRVNIRDHRGQVILLNFWATG
jgi:hypothetical protein